MTQLVDAFPATSIPSEAEAFRAEVKAFLTQRLARRPGHLRAQSWMGYDADFSRELAARGWIGLTLPKSYGGGGKDALARFVLLEELLASGAPVAAHWIAERQSAPLVLRYGTEAQRQFYLPRICRAEAFFCIGMSEPDAGSDLASIKSRANRDSNGWILNGTKLWTTHAQNAHYMIALVRTSGSTEDRQKGLSQFIVDLSLPGIEVRPIMELTGHAHFAEVHFNNVALPDDALIGDEGNGWEQVNAELAFERSGPERIYSSLALLDSWVSHLTTVDACTCDTVRLGRLVGRMAALRAMSLALMERVANGESPLTEAALFKDLGTEVEQAIPAEIADALASSPDQVVDPALVQTLAYTTLISPTYSLRGGTREILRSMIARGLGLR